MKRIDMKGSAFGYLMVLEQRGTSKRGEALWLCRCVCGVSFTVPGSYLRTGHSKSCGCMRGAYVAASKTTHGFAPKEGKRRPEYGIWKSMHQRCRDKNCGGYHNYGGRGITVCPRWDRFEHFLADMGARPAEGYSLDRVNNNGNYTPDNCRWATSAQQAANRRNNRFFMGGTISAAARRLGIPRQNLARWIGRGESYLNVKLRERGIEVEASSNYGGAH